MNGELLRIIDSIHRDKDISLDILFGAIQDAMASALMKRTGTQTAIAVSIDRETGEISVEGTEEPVDPRSLGRIAAQAAKQVIVQKIREAERDVILHDYEDRLHHIVNGTVQKVESGHVIINLGKTEGILPRSEAVREETYRIGDRLRCYVLEVKKAGGSVRIILSRSHPALVKKLFELEVPEITERIVEVVTLAREPGYRTKVAVSSVDSKVDPVGACVGVRGTRIKNIVAEVGGERIDIVRWSDQPDILIANALNPAEIEAISLNTRAKLARVIVAQDQLARAIGARGQNVRLASKLTGWDIDVMSQQELDGELEKMKKTLGRVQGVGEKTISKLFDAGFSMKKLTTSSSNSILTVEGIGESTAEKLIQCATNYVAEERAQFQKQKEAAAKAAEQPEAPAPEPETEQIQASDAETAQTEADEPATQNEEESTAVDAQETPEAQKTPETKLE